MSCKIEEDGALVALRQAISKDKHAGSKGVKILMTLWIDLVQELYGIIR